MAEVIGSFDFSRERGVDKYPWNEWCDGKIRVIKQGVDFRLGLKAMRSVLGAGGKRKGLLCHTKGNKLTGEITFKMYKP